MQWPAGKQAMHDSRRYWCGSCIISLLGWLVPLAVLLLQVFAVEEVHPDFDSWLGLILAGVAVQSILLTTMLGFWFYYRHVAIVFSDNQVQVFNKGQLKRVLDRSRVSRLIIGPGGVAVYVKGFGFGAAVPFARWANSPTRQDGPL
ncbi:MAG: hypothetical protein AAGI46_10270 [Planctomycetota bacterium]